MLECIEIILIRWVRSLQVHFYFPNSLLNLQQIANGKSWYCARRGLCNAVASTVHNMLKSIILKSGTKAHALCSNPLLFMLRFRVSSPAWGEMAFKINRIGYIKHHHAGAVWKSDYTPCPLLNGQWQRIYVLIDSSDLPCTLQTNWTPPHLAFKIAPC